MNEIINAPIKMSNLELVAAVMALTARVDALEAGPAIRVARSENAVDMTDAQAEAVTYGEDAGMKHKEAAAKYGLTYGQIYSARLEFTFKPVHKAAKEAGKTNPFVK